MRHEHAKRMREARVVRSAKYTFASSASCSAFNFAAASAAAADIMASNSMRYVCEQCRTGYMRLCDKPRSAASFRARSSASLRKRSCRSRDHFMYSRRALIVRILCCAISAAAQQPWRTISSERSCLTSWTYVCYLSFAPYTSYAATCEACPTSKVLLSCLHAIWPQNLPPEHGVAYEQSGTFAPFSLRNLLGKKRCNDYDCTACTDR